MVATTKQTHLGWLAATRTKLQNILDRLTAIAESAALRVQAISENERLTPQAQGEDTRAARRDAAASGRALAEEVHNFKRGLARAARLWDRRALLRVARLPDEPLSRLVVLTETSKRPTGDLLAELDNFGADSWDASPAELERLRATVGIVLAELEGRDLAERDRDELHRVRLHVLHRAAWQDADEAEILLAECGALAEAALGEHFRARTGAPTEANRVARARLEELRAAQEQARADRLLRDALSKRILAKSDFKNDDERAFYIGEFGKTAYLELVP